ncbi:hypothetical protein CANARDRAFT_28046 [[Candida] arabinofermentans NRRL YB-2248]|uniref:Peptidase A1 domain-containing protein n=1 Tax=[Candida] arabinofermentans NRRL YB-2248 TaxID=983967 RepID=A0A1E4T2J8_9ASCO|nr:hypothetical protein CANARDRAFT_28046 [[Candida] arabinofermentans NRRL YB-2248]
MILWSIIPFLFSLTVINANDSNHTTTSTSSTTSSSSLYTTTDSLPTLYLTNRENKVYDYQLTVGDPNVTMKLRLDVQNNFCWLPAVDGFTTCATTTTAATTTSSSSGGSDISSVSSSSASTASTAGSLSDACASQGIYDIYNSSTGYFWSFSDGDEKTNRLSATPIFSIFANYIYIAGYYAIDDFQFPVSYENDTNTNIFVDTMMFINTNDSNVGTGGLGVGLVSDNGLSSNFISYMVQDELISTNSYSLALINNDSEYAELILGGINKSKYTGDFTLFDFIPVLDESMSIISENGGYSNDYPSIPISGLGVTSNSSGSSVKFSESYNDQLTTDSGTYPKPAMLDSRTFYNYIPYSTLIEIAVELNAYYAESVERWIVDCSIANAGTLDIYFGNETIHIPIGELIYPATSANGTNLTFKDGDNACFLAFLPDYQIGYSVLGTPFLRSVYLAVDNENRQLAIAALAMHASPPPIKSSSSSSSSSSTTTSKTKTKTKTNDKQVTSKTSTTTSTSSTHSLYPITSGTIPFAKSNNLTNYGQLTLTIPSSINATATIENSSIAFISNGEVLIGTEVPMRTSNSLQSSMSASGSYSSSSSGGANANAFGNVTDGVLDLFGMSWVFACLIVFLNWL